MRSLLGIGSLLAFIAIADLPIGYYTFLRIYLTFVAVIMVFTKYGQEDTINLGAILFGITAIIFNPIIPVYLHDKSTWAVIDIAVGVLFAVEAFRINSGNGIKAT